MALSTTLSLRPRKFFVVVVELMNFVVVVDIDAVEVMNVVVVVVVEVMNVVVVVDIDVVEVMNVVVVFGVFGNSCRKGICSMVSRALYLLLVHVAVTMATGSVLALITSAFSSLLTLSA